MYGVYKVSSSSNIILRRTKMTQLKTFNQLVKWKHNFERVIDFETKLIPFIFLKGFKQHAAASLLHPFAQLS